MVKRRIYRILLMLCLAVSATAIDSAGKKTTIKLKAPKEKVSSVKKNHKKTATDKEEFSAVARQLTFTGYDKKANATTETFFIHNNSDQTLTSLELEISYLSESGNLLHKRIVEIDETIPAGESRKIDIPSWDKQKNFHYVKSDAGKKGSAPFTVRFKVISFVSGNS